MLSDAELDRIELHAKSLPFGTPLWFDKSVQSLIADYRRLRGARAVDAELEAIRERNRADMGVPEFLRHKMAKEIDTLLAHIAFQSTVIADLRADLANENQWAAGFRACREMVDALLAQGVKDFDVPGYHAEMDVLEETRVMVASLTPEQYAAQTRREDEL